MMKRVLCWSIAIVLLLCVFTVCLFALHHAMVPSLPSDELSRLTEPEVITNPDVTEPATTEPEETQPTEPLPEPDDTAFVRIADYIPNVKVELAYATVDNFTGYRIYDFDDAYLRYGTVKKLQKVSAALQEYGVGLIIWDAFRPIAAQAALWEICPDPTYVSNPQSGRRAHCRGNTVDISVYDLASGKELKMPTGFDNFTAYADRDYSDCAQDAAANARLLEQLMEDNGFEPYFGEWWHFADVTDYPVEAYFYPDVPIKWVANCESYLNLRDESGNVIGSVPNGATMQLLGWDYAYAKVDYNGTVGCVASDYILPANSDYLDEMLSTVLATDTYTYAQLLADMATLAQQYSQTVEVSVIGVSELGRDIPVIRLGREDAKYHILLQGAIHGREHMTAWLLMAMTDYWLNNGILSYGDVCYHIIPMVNPDGVTISQTGQLNDAQNAIFLSDIRNEYTTEDITNYANRWKANGMGVDLNRNFSSGWNEIKDRTGPSAQGYKGTEPFSASETAALRDYTLKYDFDATISYHSSGELIYYSYGDKKEVNSQSESLGKAVSGVSGYILVDGNSDSHAGYKDWAMDALEIPSLTIEIGRDTSPLTEREIYSTFVRNIRVLPAITRWLQSR